MRTRPTTPVRIAAALCFAVAAAHSPVAAQGGSPEDVTLQMAGAVEVFAARGLRPAGTPFTGALNDGAEASHRVQLSAGVRYLFSGVCDNDCSDFDLQLSDAGGTAVASDVEIDDTPIVSVTPTRSGVYTVRGVMASCDQNPCYYGIGIYGSAPAAAPAAGPAPATRPAPAPAAGRGSAAAVRPGVYACTEVVNIYTGSTYTPNGSYPNYASSLQSRGSITITGANTYRMGDTNGEFSYDAASGEIRWRSGGLALPLVRGGRYGPNAQTRNLELVVITSSGGWTCTPS